MGCEIVRQAPIRTTFTTDRNSPIRDCVWNREPSPRILRRVLPHWIVEGKYVFVWEIPIRYVLN
jgi:hypothetical protein